MKRKRLGKRFNRSISLIMAVTLAANMFIMPAAAAGTGNYEQTGMIEEIQDGASADNKSIDNMIETEITEIQSEAPLETQANIESELRAENTKDASIRFADSNLEGLEPGLLGEIFTTDAYRGGPIELFNFEQKTGEVLFDSLNGQNLRPVFDSFNGVKGDSQFATSRFTGKLKVDKPGNYKFFCEGDDGFRVWVDGNLAIDFWVQEWEKEQASPEITLTAGMHDIKIEHLQGWGGAYLKLQWESSNAGISKAVIPTSAFYHSMIPADAGLSAQIYQVEGTPGSISAYGFKGEPKKTVLKNLDGTDSLKEAIQASNGSSEYATAIIHGLVTPQETGEYEFVMNGDDGFRLWVDDELIINSWKLHSDQVKTSKSIHLEQGRLYKIRINYAQADGDANLNLSWKMNQGEVSVIPQKCLRQGTTDLPGDSSTVVHGLLGEVYGDIFLEEKKGEFLVPVLDKSFGVINTLSKYNGSGEYGSFRFTGQVEVPEEGDYTFYLIGDDGFRLWVNGELAIDFWESKWDKQQESQPIHLMPGRNDIQIEYFQGFGGAYILLEWMKPGAELKEVIPTDLLYPASTQKGLIGEISQTKNQKTEKIAEVLTTAITGEQLNVKDLVAYYAGDVSADTGLRYAGKIRPEESGTYQLSLGSTGSYQVLLDGEKVIEAQTSASYTETQSKNLELEKGIDYQIEIQIEHAKAEEKVELSWTKDGVKTPVPAQVLYAPEAMWYENVLAREELYAVVSMAADLRKNTSVGTGNGNISGENMDKFSKVLDEANIHARDFDEVSMILKEDTRNLTDAVSEFKVNIIMPQEGRELTQFNNGLYQGQDPFISYQDGYYYFVSSSNDPGHNKMYVSKSKSLLDQGEKVRIFDFDDSKSRIFAPEMFFIDGKWYIYYCADAREYNWRHMACVLESVTDDPQGDWIDRGVLYTGKELNNPNEYAQGNDFTVFEYRDQLYACWGSMESGVESPAIARMESPIKISEERSFLPSFGGEGPRAVVNGDRLFMTVSQGNFKTAGYHLGMYTFDITKDSPLDSESWSYTEGVFEGTKDVYGPARASFFKSADGTEDWMAFHSKVYPANLNAWRQVSIKQFTWNEDGSPNFGKPVSPYEFVNLPSGDPGLGKAYEAEHAALSDGAQKGYKGKGYQGSGYANITNQDGEKAAFKVQAEEAGDYFVRARYANGVKAPINGVDGKGEWESDIPDITPKAGTLNLYVNGAAGKAATVLFDKTETDWQHWMTVCSRVTLQKGENTLTYIKDAENTGNIYLDYITVQKAHDVPAPQTVKTPQELSALIDGVRDLSELDYSVETWRIFSGALLGAVNVKTDEAHVQAVSNRYLALDAAIKDLSTKVRIHTDQNTAVNEQAEDGMYQIGSNVTVKPKEVEGQRFMGWTAAGIELSEEQKTAESLTFTVPRDRVTISAIFEDRESYKLTTGDKVSIEHPSEDGMYRAGVTIKAAAEAVSGQEFVEWKVTGITLTETQKKSQTISFTMPENEVTLSPVRRAVVAPEKPKYKLTPGPNVIIENPANDNLYLEGTSVRASVKIPSGQVFAEWNVTGIHLSDSQKKSPVILFSMPGNSVTVNGVFKAAPAPEKKNQTITAKSVKKAYGSKPFKLSVKRTGDGKLSFKSANTKIVKIDSSGKISIKGVGTTQITIQAAATAAYNGASKKINITIAPRKEVIIKLTSSKSKTAKISWKKDASASGYEVRYSMDKKFKKNVKTLKITKNKLTSAVIKKLKPGKKYYFKVRAYKTSDKSKIYGDYSKVRSIPIKK